MTTTADLPDLESEDFDHITEAKEQIAHVTKTGTFDYTMAIAAAQTHALISIAQSLDLLVSETVFNTVDYSIENFNIVDIGPEVTDENPKAPASVKVNGKPLIGMGYDYYREG